jgi:DNA invertase Pin-like site-specific DNA recombinase
MAIYGYARVSTEDQELGLQITALTEAGVAKKDIVKEKASGKEGADRPKYVELLAKLRDGDKLVVWKVDRLGRSTLDALNTAKDLDARGVRIVITTLGVDLKTPAGRLVYGVLAQIAEFERELIRERVTAGIAAARKRGVAFGRRHTLRRINGLRPSGCTSRKARASARLLRCSAAGERSCIGQSMVPSGRSLLRSKGAQPPAGHRDRTLRSLPGARHSVSSPRSRLASRSSTNRSVVSDARS